MMSASIKAIRLNSIVASTKTGKGDARYRGKRMERTDCSKGRLQENCIYMLALAVFFGGGSCKVEMAPSIH